MLADEPLEVPNRGGRPCVEIDLETVRNSARIGCTVNEIAAVLGIGRSTMFKYMALDQTIQEAIDAGRDEGCGTLRRFQWHKAEAGSDTMLIWLGKQMLGQKDRSELTGAGDGPMRVQIEIVGTPPAQVAAEAEPRRISRYEQPAVEIDFVGSRPTDR